MGLVGDPAENTKMWIHTNKKVALQINLLNSHAQIGDHFLNILINIVKVNSKAGSMNIITKAHRNLGVYLTHAHLEVYFRFTHAPRNTFKDHVKRF